jgi:hypothetical protein
VELALAALAIFGVGRTLDCRQQTLITFFETPGQVLGRKEVWNKNPGSKRGNTGTK